MEWALGAEKKPRIDDAKLVIGKDNHPSASVNQGPVKLHYCVQRIKMEKLLV